MRGVFFERILQRGPSGPRFHRVPGGNTSNAGEKGYVQRTARSLHGSMGRGDNVPKGRIKGVEHPPIPKHGTQARSKTQPGEPGIGGKTESLTRFGALAPMFGEGLAGRAHVVRSTLLTERETRCPSAEQRAIIREAHRVPVSLYLHRSTYFRLSRAVRAEFGIIYSTLCVARRILSSGLDALKEGMIPSSQLRGLHAAVSRLRGRVSLREALLRKYLRYLASYLGRTVSAFRILGLCETMCTGP